MSNKNLFTSAFTVYKEYNFEALCHYISSVTNTEFQVVHTKIQLNYLHHYLTHKEVNTKSVVVEHEYIEKSYLEDYADYFVRCFNDYGKKSTRIHFFSCEFSELEFSNLLAGGKENQSEPFSFKKKSKERLSPNSKTRFFLNRTRASSNNKKLSTLLDSLQENYIGYIVIRPIPRTFIASGAIRPYKYILNDETKNVLLKNIQVNLFGIELKVDALPFQEQDRVVSACATSSLWTYLNAPIFNLKDIPSPSTISKMAFSLPEASKLDFHTSGLDPYSMSSIFRSLGLSPIEIGKDVMSFEEADKDCALTNRRNFIRHLKEIVYSYNSFKLPIIMGLEVYERESDDGPFIYKGSHAVTIVGYSLNRSKFTKLESEIDDIDLKSDDINYFYIHDDQLGPYARTEITNDNLRIIGGPQNEDSHLRDANSQIKIKIHQSSLIDKERVYLPNLVMLGVYPKIRIPYIRIKNTCISFNARIVDLFLGGAETSEALKKFINITEKGFLWDIKLTNVNELKKRIINIEKHKIVSSRLSLLSKSMPKYIWSAIAKDDLNHSLFEFLFDATDIQQGAVFLETIYYDLKYKMLVDQLLKESFETAFRSPLEQNYFYLSTDDITEIGKSIIEEKQSYSSYLDEHFGPPRPPAYYKVDEVSNNAPVVQSKVTTQKLLSEPLSQNKPLDTDVKYIWLICSEGFLHIGDDSQGGHPTLGNSIWARIAGELLFKEKTQKWQINPFSGRYMRHREWHSQQHMINAGLMIEKYTGLNDIDVVHPSQEVQP